MGAQEFLVRVALQGAYGLLIFAAIFAAAIVFRSPLAFILGGGGVFAVVQSQSLLIRLRNRDAAAWWWLSVVLAVIAIIVLVRSF